MEEPALTVFSRKNFAYMETENVFEKMGETFTLFFGEILAVIGFKVVCFNFPKV